MELGKRGRRRRASRAVLGSIGSVEPFFVVVPTCKEKLRLQKRKKGLPVSGTRGEFSGSAAAGAREALMPEPRGKTRKMMDQSGNKTELLGKAHTTVCKMPRTFIERGGAAAGSR